jgi:outer membrane beta-barrel protein
MTKVNTLWVTAALFGVAIAGMSDARAEERRSSGLSKDVAVRGRRLYVSGRFEATPMFESSINADFQHNIGGGLKLEYHLGDMFSIGVIGVASTQFNTSLVNRIKPTLPTQNDKLNMQKGPDGMLGTADDVAIREPSQDEFMDRLNSMPFHGAAYVSLTPWYGKLAAFSTANVAFDFYFQAGVAFATLKTSCPSSVCSDQFPGLSHPGIVEGMPGTVPPDDNPNNDPPLNDGQRLGLYLGGGIHVFLNDFLALDMSVRDYAFSDNPSGADYNADLFVGTNTTTNSDDNRFLNHLFFGAGISIMLPPGVKRTP